MLVFLMAFAIVSWQLRESEQQRALLARSRQEVVEKAAAAVKAQNRAEVVAAERARELYTSDMLAIQQAWEAGNIDRMGELLGRHIPTVPTRRTGVASSGTSSRGFMKRPGTH